MNIRIKNCGLNTEASVQAAVQSGADFAGFMQYPPSPRHITLAQAAEFACQLPAAVQSVAVLVNPTDTELSALLREWRPGLLQLHGEETPLRLSAIREQSGLPVIKAISVATMDDVTSARQYQTVADMLLFDTKHDTVRGGSGVAFDWGLLASLSISKPWFLSGGLDAANVVEAVRRTRAPMVDVSSGIESSRGVKDPDKIHLFNRQLKAGS